MTVKKIEISDWKCKNGHLLGIVQRNRKGSARLILYRSAIDGLAGEPAQVDVIAVVEAAVDIRCSICDEMRAWAPNQESFERLMGHYAGRKGIHAESVVPIEPGQATLSKNKKEQIKGKITPCSQEKNKAGDITTIKKKETIRVIEAAISKID